MQLTRTNGGQISAGAIQNATHTYAQDAEASDAYAIVMSPVTTAYVEGQEYSFKANTANTGASSLNVDGLGAKTLKKLHDQDTATGDIEAGSIVKVQYDGTVFQILSVSASTVIGAQDSVQFNTGLGAPAHSEGLIFYDDVNKALGYYIDEADVTLQIGQESWIRVINNTGSTVTDGQVVYVSGASAGLPVITLAQADIAPTADSVIGLATHDIENGTQGIITTFGLVRGINTAGFSIGDVLYLDSSSAGALTKTKPVFPNYTIRIGTVLTSDASGDILVNVVGMADDIVVNNYNGSILETVGFTVTSNGSVITASLEKSGGGNVTLLFSDGFSTYVTAPATIALTAGSDTTPQINYIYIPKSTKVLTVSTSGFPSTEHAPVATVLCQSASSLQNDKAHKVHVWTDHMALANDNGHLSHINAWIRAQHASWISGVALTPTIGTEGGAEDTVDIATSAGAILQLHSHTFPAFDTAVSSDVYIVNKNGANYTKIQDLQDADEDSSGNAIANNQHINLVIWGVVSEATGDCKLYINLPSELHGNSGEVATIDAGRFSNYNIPENFKGVGFLIARLTLKYTTASSGTWALVENLDLRGTFPSTFAGGTASTTNEFIDNVFRLLDNGDITKELAFELSGLTTATTRTITVPDVDGTAVLSGEDTVASDATPDPVGDKPSNLFTITALAVNATVSAPSGTPVSGNRLIIRIKDNATPRTLAWNAIYRASTDLALPTTTVTSKTMYLGFVYNSTDSKWDLLAFLDNV